MLDTHRNPEVCGDLYAEDSGAREDATVKLSEMDQHPDHTQTAHARADNMGKGLMSHCDLG